MKMLKVGVIIVAVLMIVGLAIACGGNHSPAPVTIIDSSITIEGNHTKYWDLEPGLYDVDISSDDGLQVEWIGGGVDQGNNSDGAVKEYHRTVRASESTTLKIFNPGGIFSNPTALVHLKIGKAQ
jgi:hypothetical protein